MQIMRETVQVVDLGEGYPADARIVEVRGVNGKSYYHAQGWIPVAQALRLALRVVEAGVIDPQFWGCEEDERRDREDYHLSGQAAFDERAAEATYDADCRASFQAILAAENGR